MRRRSSVEAFCYSERRLIAGYRSFYTATQSLTTMAGSPACGTGLRFGPRTPTKKIEITELSGTNPVLALLFEDERLEESTDGGMAMGFDLCAYPAEHVRG